MPPPPPPPPPGPGPPPPSFGGGSKAGGTPNRSALLDQIHHGAKLKKTVTNDRSAPQVGDVKSTGGGGHGGRGGGGNTGRGGGPAALGNLFAGGKPQLKSAGQARVPGGAGGPALKPPGAMSNGPTNTSTNGSNKLPNGGPPLPPPSINKPSVNKFAPPALPSNQNKPRNTGPAPPPASGNNKPVNGGTPGRLNTGAFRKFTSSSMDEEDGAETSQPKVLSLAGGLPSRTTPNHSSVPKPPVHFGGPPSAAATPPPPPGRPPPSNANRPSSMLGRPLPAPPGDNENVVSGQQPPPPPSRGAAPPPPLHRVAAPPLPPQRTPHISSGGTIGRSGPPNIQPPMPRRGSTGSGPAPLPPQVQPPPLPPQVQPPPVARGKLSSSSFNGDDFETRFRFHQSQEFPHPEPFSNGNKVYPSKQQRNFNPQRPPPPQPPR